MITAIIVILVTMNYCKKETDTNVVNNNNLKSGQTMTKADSLFAKKIILFDSIMNEYMLDNNYSFNKQFNIDSAIFYLEAWFNAKYAFPDESYINVVRVDTTMIISLSQGLVSMDNIYNKIISIKSRTESKYNGLAFSKKALILVHLKRLSSPNLNQIDFELQMTFGELGVKDPALSVVCNYAFI